MPTSIYYANLKLAELDNQYLSLHSADPGRTGANEIAGGSYVRKQVSLAAPSGGATSNDTEILWSAGLPAGTVSHVAIWDAANGGNCLWCGALTTGKTVDSTDELKFSVGDLDISLT